MLVQFWCEWWLSVTVTTQNSSNQLYFFPFTSRPFISGSLVHLLLSRKSGKIFVISADVSSELDHQKKNIYIIFDDFCLSSCPTVRVRPFYDRCFYGLLIAICGVWECKIDITTNSIGLQLTCTQNDCNHRYYYLMVALMTYNVSAIHLFIIFLRQGLEVIFMSFSIYIHSNRFTPRKHNSAFNI